MKQEIILNNGILTSSKDVEIFNDHVRLHDTVDGWTTYKIPIDLYKSFLNKSISYWDMIEHSSVKEV